MRVEVWSDLVCPWCGIGQARLDAALASVPFASEIEVVHRAFQLDPNAPVGRTVPVRTMLMAKYRLDAERFRVQTARIEAIAAADGLAPYEVADNAVGNTSLAHQMLAFAVDAGRAHEAWRRAYRAYFGERRDIFSREGVLALGAEIGLEIEGLTAALDDGRYLARIHADQDEAGILGSRGVPFVLIDRRLGVSGAQPVAVFRDALVRAWESRVLVDDIAAGATCSDGGCELP